MSAARPASLWRHPGSVVVDGAGGNLTLVPGGPAVNVGTTTSAQVPTDRLGVPRPHGSGTDIGAYEWTGTAPPIDPPPGAIRPPSGADTTAPTVVLTSPSAGPVSGTVTLDATATDNVGVVGLQYFLDGVGLGGEQSQAPYKQDWDTSTATPGPHTLSVSCPGRRRECGDECPGECDGGRDTARAARRYASGVRGHSSAVWCYGHRVPTTTCETLDRRHCGQT